MGPISFPLGALAVDGAAPEPLYRQVEDQIRAAIRAARLRPGQRLPSTRQLAGDLGTARNTIKAAYNQLIVEGYLIAAAGSGTRVAADLPETLLHVPTASASPPATAPPLALATRQHRAVSRWLGAGAPRPARPFRPHAPSTDAFPRKLWHRLTANQLRRMPRGLLEGSDSRGYGPLREAVAGYLGAARGVACGADQVIITAGTQQAVDLIAKLSLAPGDRVCMEDPGYTPARIVFEMAGADVTTGPIDSEGLDISRLPASAKLVYVTPSSQFPLAVTMSLHRRLALVDWAERHGTVIVEDDYNGEYRYAGRPLPALYGLAPPGRVLYTGSFSKLLFPALRLGYLVVPADLADDFAAARWLADRHSPPLEQAVLADFIDGGHFARHLRRMRTLYAERQAALAAAAADHLAGIMTVPANDAGLHLLGWLDPGVTEAAVLRAGAAAALDLTPTSWFAVNRPRRASIVLGYAPFTPRQIDRAAGALATAYRNQS